MTNYKGSSQEKADKKYREKVSADEDLRKRRSKMSAFRTAKSYIRNHATLEELEELKNLIKDCESNLKDKKD
ncbi:hypothetical protein [Enterococcus alishanensis]